jgi:hypothetical protein
MLPRHNVERKNGTWSSRIGGLLVLGRNGGRRKHNAEVLDLKSVARELHVPGLIVRGVSDRLIQCFFCLSFGVGEMAAQPPICFMCRPKWRQRQKGVGHRMPVLRRTLARMAADSVQPLVIGRCRQQPSPRHGQRPCCPCKRRT